MVPHAGAALPVLADRVAGLAPLISPAPPGPRPSSAPPVDVIAALGRLNYDLAGTPLPRALPALLRLAGTSQLVYGSEYPFTPAATVRALTEVIAGTDVLDDEARAAALSGNGYRLLPRLAAANRRRPAPR